MSEADWKSRAQAAEAEVSILRREVEGLKKGSSVAGLPAHVADATATEAQHSAGWRDIDSVPRDGTEVILCCGARVGAAFWITWPSTPTEEAGEGWSIGADGYTWGGVFVPTHWMPLPSPPGEAAGPAIGSSNRLEAIQASLTAIRERVEGLTKALEPFATAFDLNSTDGPCLTEADIRGMHNHIEVQDFRRAAQALRNYILGEKP